jgi:hypothetical protein
VERPDVSLYLLATGFLISSITAIAFTIIAVGPRSWAEARNAWRNLLPNTPADAVTVISKIAQMRRDPEMANMYFLSRFIVMVVLESFGQLVSGILAALPGLKYVPDRILSLPVALLSLWLAAECLIAYRRITNFDAFRASLITRISSMGYPAEDLKLLSDTAVLNA